MNFSEKTEMVDNLSSIFLSKLSSNLDDLSPESLEKIEKEFKTFLEDRLFILQGSYTQNLLDPSIYDKDIRRVIEAKIDEKISQELALADESFYRFEYSPSLLSPEITVSKSYLLFRP